MKLRGLCFAVKKNANICYNYTFLSLPQVYTKGGDTQVENNIMKAFEFDESFKAETR